MYCSNCAKEISDLTASCPNCGHPNCGHPSASLHLAGSKKSKLTVILFCLFLGGLGMHRYYVGKIGTGILQTLTLGGLGIWSLIDLIMLICGTFKDSEGNYID